MAQFSSHRATLLLVTLLFQLALSSEQKTLLGGPDKIECVPACDVRCSKSWKQKMCKKMCNICCDRCNCVPEGTSVETRAACPCYANMKNPKGFNKCP